MAQKQNGETKKRIKSMRVISQDGYTDLPYEQVIVCLNGLDITEVIALGVDVISDDGFWTIAKYSNKEKALKAMEMLRDAYSCTNIFQFPKDEEVMLNGGRWIPVDKPPKIGQSVLLSFENLSVVMTGYYDGDEQSGAYYDDYDRLYTEQNLFVNAWQPLPNPYRDNWMKKTN
jgi:hypothetical protein